MQKSKEKTSKETLEIFIKKLEEEYFIGREKEIILFKRYLDEPNDSMRILNVYGIGGVGKTYLLYSFNRLAEQEDYLFLHIDSRDFIHTPLTFAENIFTQIYSKLETTQLTSSFSLQDCIHLLNQLAIDKKIIIAIDSYEEMGDLDRWFREVLLRQMPQNIIIVLAGRNKLTGEWMESPAWRKVIRYIHLEDFSFNQMKTYLSQHNIEDEHVIKSIWAFTKGHPLATSLATLTQESPEIVSQVPTDNIISVLTQLTQRWLAEVKDKQLYELIEAAAILRHFDQSSLSFILQYKVPTNLFIDLTSLSFIKQRKNGWAIHDLIRDAIRADFSYRNPDKFEILNQHCVALYRNKINQQHSVWYLGEFFYHLGDEFIQSAFFQDSSDSDLYLEHVDHHNFHEVETYFLRRKETLAENKVDFLNRETNNTYSYYVSLQHNKKESDLINANYISKMGYNVARILRNTSGNTLGISITVPINERTISQLAEQPVSRCYFQGLSTEEYNQFAVRSTTNSGHFIRMLDCLDPYDTTARSFLLYNLFPLLLSGGIIVTSTPLPFFQNLLKSFGFQEVPNRTHYDFGDDVPSPTYILDVRGERLVSYLDKFTDLKNMNDPIHLITNSYSFTDRERDIVKLILEDYSNAAIAKELYLAEVTVKKHISRILKKVNVKNRSQLIKKLMEVVYL